MGQGSLKIGVKDERGFIVSKDYGFTVEEESQVLAFDTHETQDGTLLLFGNQVFFMKFWKEEELQKGLRLLDATFRKELDRRATSPESERGLKAYLNEGEDNG